MPTSTIYYGGCPAIRTRTSGSSRPGAGRKPSLRRPRRPVPAAEACRLSTQQARSTRSTSRRVAHPTRRRRTVTDKMQQNKRFSHPQNYLESLIEFCRDKGKLNGSFVDAEEVRDAGNRVLHMKGCGDLNAWDVLRKTRKIIAIIYGRDSGKEEG